ncbi:hypothetical protein BDQ12DRAFT_733973 [Crucibulum laeve]|uniref:F-box domain-containing protein n=1 Tax=Crucibulum laeve TaxID=68775 RepID=A0A5C3M8L6_9AGAR|nr:hypothetical protein BDQ12DRAFT_733973 [Crucibulum laeve]
MAVSYIQSEELCPEDIIYEILSLLAVADIIRSRKTCHRIRDASFQRDVWAAVYQTSEDLLLPPGPFASQTSAELEKILVRATLLHLKWTSDSLSILPERRRSFPRELGMFQATVISARYLILLEFDGMRCYDLDADHVDSPLLYYDHRRDVGQGRPYFLSYQINVKEEGLNNTWVAFGAGSKILILELGLDDSNLGVELLALLPSDDVVAIKMERNYLIQYRIIGSDLGTLQEEHIFHIPRKMTYKLPIPDGLWRYNLKHREYVIMPYCLIAMCALRDIGLRIDVYKLPTETSLDSCKPPSRRLLLTHTHVYETDIVRFEVLESSFDTSSRSNTQARVRLLGLSYPDRNSPSWEAISRTALCLLELILSPSGMLDIKETHSEEFALGFNNAGFTQTSQNGICLAASHFIQGVILGYYLRYGDQTSNSIVVKKIGLPIDIHSRRLLSFDGFRGRMAVVHKLGSRIEILDYA